MLTTVSVTRGGAEIVQMAGLDALAATAFALSRHLSQIDRQQDTDQHESTKRDECESGVHTG